MAHRLRVTRSELYAKAIIEFLEKENVSAITESLNQLYSAHPAELDAALHRAQLASLKEDDW